MADITVGYLQDYATITLAEAAATAGDTIILNESDEVGNLNHRFFAQFTKPLLYVAGVKGINILNPTGINTNSASLIKFTGLGIYTEGNFTINITDILISSPIYSDLFLQYHSTNQFFFQFMKCLTDEDFFFGIFIL